jgi:hypothetical protein
MPITNGSPITGYKVYIREHNSDVYTQEEIDCLGNSESVINTRECYIYLDTLIIDPYSLILNEEIWAKVIATNFYGDSPYSEEGNNGLTKLIPDAPVNLQNDASVTDAFNIKIDWEDGISDGGMPVLDHRLYWAHIDENYQILVEGVADREYTATESFIHGDLYKFKI